jgi:hypothetical protein
MKNLGCQHETAVLHAFKTGKWDVFTQSHFQSCPICRQQAEVWNWMQALAEQTFQEARRTDYGPVWLKAQFQGRQNAEKQALRPLRIFQTAAEIMMALVLLGFSILGWPLMKAWLEKSTPDFSIDALNTSIAGAPAILMLLFGILFLFVTFFLAVNSFATDD